MKNYILAKAASVTAAAALLCFAQTAIAVEPAAIALGNYEDLFLQTGNANDIYWGENNSWGAGAIIRGTASDQFEQQIGVSPTAGSNGEVAFRMKWRWPSPEGAGEVKGYPAILSGAKPGYAGGKQVMLPNGSRSGWIGVTPGSIFPLQLPIKSLKGKFAVKNAAAPTGQGQLTYDIWLQSAPGQDNGWANSSITHEIMIPLQNWGNYGAHNVPWGRNPGWYDHSATIDGRLYHVYATKGGDGALLYNFGWLNGTYGKTGWKMIAFVPDVLPVPAGEIDLAAIINYLATRKDAKGNPWALGNEYVVSAELGVEPVSGTGDITVYDYKVSTTSSAPAPAPVISNPPTTTATAWVNGKQYAAGSVVTLNGVQYVAKFDNPGYNPEISTYFWAVKPATGTVTPPASGGAAPTCSNTAAWDGSKWYVVGSIASQNGKVYIATSPSKNSSPHWTQTHWSVYLCGGTASPAPAPVVTAASCANTAAWDGSKWYVVGSIVSQNGNVYVATSPSTNSSPHWTQTHWSLKTC